MKPTKSGSMSTAFQSATQLARMVRSKKISASELLALYTERIREHNGKINAIVVHDLSRAKKAAKEADARLANPKTTGELGPLFGVPITVKESFDVAGLPTTWGLPQFAGVRVKSSARAVEKLREAGAILFGKTNVPVMLADWQTFNPVYGTTNNPWDPSRTPGGSSGGSAAAVAAGLTGLEFGSDIAGSIRDPAHYCGIYGHKPTYGVVPMRGHALAGAIAPPDLSVIGPLARSADDLEVALLATAGPGPAEDTAWKLVLPRCSKRNLGDFRVAVMTTDPVSEVDQSVQDQLLELGKFLSRAGAKVSYRARPALDSQQVHRAFIQLLRSATSGRETPERFAQLLAAARSLPPDDGSYYAEMVRGNTMYHKEWLATNEQRHRFRLAWMDFFQQWDLLLCPAAATAAFPQNQSGERWERMIMVNGSPQPSTTQMFWAGYSGLTGLPSTVAPIGLSGEMLPIGVQIVGAPYQDLTCIRFAQLLQASYYGFQPPPGCA